MNIPSYESIDARVKAAELSNIEGFIYNWYPALEIDQERWMSMLKAALLEVEKTTQNTTAMLQFLKDNEDSIYEHIKDKFNTGFTSRQMDVAIEVVNFIIQKLERE